MWGFERVKNYIATAIFSNSEIIFNNKKVRVIWYKVIQCYYLS